ncbi:MAG TPA: DUF58 domain-containing protein [Steroidobacteraceae bacterium]
MHLAQRAHLLIFLTAVLAIGGIWARDSAFADLWRIPAAMVLIGVAVEGLLVRKLAVTADVETAARGFLGREQPAAFAFHNPSARALRIEYAPVTPPGIELGGGPRLTRLIAAAAGSSARDPVTLLPVSLGSKTWPVLPVRLRGALGLAWWSRGLRPSVRIAVAPDTLHADRIRPQGVAGGMRPRRLIGAGAELHQLRRYVRGDAPARIDWKASARTRTLITCEFSEDQHLDVLVALDAGRFSRVRSGSLDRFGQYANATARLAELVVANDDRIGLTVFADRPLAVCMPERGRPAVMRIRRTLEAMAVRSAESDAVAAALRIRSMLRHRSLIVILTDVNDAQVADQAARAVRLLAPPHLVVIAGTHSREIAELAQREAHEWIDPWVALAAEEHESRARSQRVLLRRLGAPVLAAEEEGLEQAVLAEYARLRRSRRI